MKHIKAFGRFWYDFIVGDDWTIAVAVVLAVVATVLLSHVITWAWIVLPLAVAAILTVSVWRGGRGPTLALMRSGSDLSAADARTIAVAAQGLARPRPKGPITRRQVRGVFDALNTIQVDAINVVERTQFLVLFSRLGAYDKNLVHDLTAPRGEIFEYWGHAASLLTMEHHALLRWRMADRGPLADTGSVYDARRAAFFAEHGEYIDATLAEVRDRGPLTAGQLKDPRRRDGEWWDRRSFGRQTLEYLFGHGLVAGWRAPNFERIYDLPERVIPAEVLAQPTPTVDEAQRRLLLLAARALAIATINDLASYYFIKPKAVRVRVAELVETGALVEVAVNGWREPAYALPETRVARSKREQATLLSPFDSLIWDRDRTNRVFEFDYRIEVYVPAPKRKYGYYVLPLLLGDALVARFDLKSDRKESALLVRASYLEPGADPAVVAPAAAVELDALRAWLGLDRVVLGRKGNLAPPLRRVLAA